MELFDDPGSRSIQRYIKRYNYLNTLLNAFDPDAWDHQQIPFTREYAASTCKILLTYINLYNKTQNGNNNNKHIMP